MCAFHNLGSLKKERAEWGGRYNFIFGGWVTVEKFESEINLGSSLAAQRFKDLALSV